MSKEQGPCEAWVRLAANNLGCRRSGNRYSDTRSEETL